MTRTGDDVFDAVTALTTANITSDSVIRFGELLREADLIDENADQKLELRRTMVHAMFMRLSSESEQWNNMKLLFKLHEEFGYSRLHSQIATLIVYAECALEAGDIAEAHKSVSTAEGAIHASGPERGNDFDSSTIRHIQELRKAISKHQSC